MLTKKDKETVCSRKCHVETADVHLGRGLEVRYMVLMGLTRGELNSLKRALENTDKGIGDDVHAYLRNALESAGIRCE